MAITLSEDRKSSTVSEEDLRSDEMLQKIKTGSSKPTPKTGLQDGELHIDIQGLEARYKKDGHIYKWTIIKES